VVGAYLSGLAAAGMAPQSLDLRMAAIGHAHWQADEAILHKVRLCIYAAAKCEVLPGVEHRQSRYGIQVRS